MKIRRFVLFIVYIVVGVALFALNIARVLDDFWGRFGGCLVIIGALRLVFAYRYYKDENYKERVDVHAADERNRFIRSKTWAWTGYLFILISSAASIALRVMGREAESLVLCYAVGLMLLLYWIIRAILQRKY